MTSVIAISNINYAGIEATPVPESVEPEATPVSESIEPETTPVSESIEPETTTDLDVVISNHSVVSGTWGTSEWTFDDTSGELVIFEGKLGTDRQSPWYAQFWEVPVVDPYAIKTITFAGPIVAPSNSQLLFSSSFGESGSLVNLTHFNNSSYLDMSLATSIDNMFSNAMSLTSLDVKNWNTSSITSMVGTFDAASSLTELDVSMWDTSKVTDMRYMFMDAVKLETLDVSNWDTSKVKNLRYAFLGNKKLKGLDVSKWNVGSVEDMQYMFAEFGSDSQSEIELDVSQWDTSHVKSARWMFSHSPGMKHLDLSGWNTSNMSDMSSMFARNSNIQSLDISNFDFGNVTTLGGMFSETNQLSEITVGKSFVGSKNKGNIDLPEVPFSKDYSGGWIGTSSTNKDVLFKSSTDFMNLFKADEPGTYVWQKNMATLELKDITLKTGSSWNHLDHVVSGTDRFGNTFGPEEAMWVGSPNMNVPGVYPIEVTYNFVTQTVFVKVVDSAYLTVNIVDDSDNPLRDPIVLTKEIGDKVDLTNEPLVTATLNQLIDDGYDIQLRPENESSILMEEEEQSVTYVLAGKLSFVSAPTTIDFGILPVRTSVQRINQPTNIDGQLSIRDSRKTKGNWQLSAKLSTPLSNGNRTVDDALRYVYNGNELILSQDAQIVAGQRNLTNDIFSVSDTWSADGDGIKLQTAVGSVLEKGDYRAVITWELTEAP
ncbi:BspA family leucine-rich repeat surface protein [Carnobacterium maltaromaticum]|uniref:BspA family leucine-rich repeat surface protein n=1 Tax=Carnobacterium maltaromaticum TaxID=2751 RepID=UPI00295E4834|nr:BspA family leucine-rich repeat surface protein [Carnobacterium maltaromaticum]